MQSFVIIFGGPCLWRVSHSVISIQPATILSPTKICTYRVRGFLKYTLGGYDISRVCPGRRIVLQ